MSQDDVLYEIFEPLSQGAPGDDASTLRALDAVPDMTNMRIAEESMDLIWAEGSIYVMGIERALAMWRPWLRPAGCVAFSDFAWWTDVPSEEPSRFWAIREEIEIARRYSDEACYTFFILQRYEG